MKSMSFIASFLLVSASHLAMADISTERQTELMYLLKQDCGSCHGMTLKGGLGPSLLPESLNGKPKVLLVTTILEGRTGTAMPPWKAMLTQDEAEWITVQLLQGVK
jgi:cytochrome c55X